MKAQTALDECPQITFDDLFPPEPPKPMFSSGEAVYIVSLDVVLSGKIGRKWICGTDSLYYGYDVDFDSGHHTVIWDGGFGETVFKDYDLAKQKADSLYFDKIEPAEMSLSDCQSFEYIRSLDSYRLTATIAKIGDRQLYEHAFMCYHFIRTYKDKQERDNAYKAELKKATDEVERREGLRLDSPVLETVYKVAETLYASRGYAEHNGVKGRRRT